MMMDQDKNFRLEFEVVRGGLLDCKLKITDPYGQMVIEKIAYFNKEVRKRKQANKQAHVSVIFLFTYWCMILTIVLCLLYCLSPCSLVLLG